MYIAANTIIVKADNVEEFEAYLSYTVEGHSITYSQWDYNSTYIPIMEAIEELVSYAFFEGQQEEGDMVLYKNSEGDLQATWAGMYDAQDDGEFVDKLHYSVESNGVGSFC